MSLVRRRLRQLFIRRQRDRMTALWQLLTGQAFWCARCPGCGYFEWEAHAGRDHYGWSCVTVDDLWLGSLPEGASGRRLTWRERLKEAKRLLTGRP